MSEKFFPEIITNLPNADIPIQGLGSRLFQGEGQQILFMEFGNDVEIPEHSHDAQWGVFWAGYKDVTLFNQRDRYKIREHQNR